jgi:two-component system chemotaxis sensor kinase CheA
MNLNMDSVYADFKNESKSLLEVAEKAVLEFEEGDQEAVNRIFRAAHTIKGNCGLFDLPKTKALSHSWETMLGEMRNGKIPPTTEIVDLNLECIDRVRRLLEQW